MTSKQTAEQQLAQLAQEHGISSIAMLQELIQHYRMTNEDRLTVFDPADEMPAHPAIALRQFRGLFEQSNDAVFLIGLDGRHLASNQRASELLGYSRDEFLEMTFHKIVKTSEMVQAEDVAGRLLAGQRVLPYQRTFIHKNGSEVLVEVNVDCIFDDNGEPLYLQSIVRDVRDRLHLIEELQESERLFRAIFNSTFTFVGLMSPDGKMLEVNQTALDFAGITQGDILTKPIWETAWFNPLPDLQQQIREAVEKAATGQFVRLELPIFGQHGRQSTVDFSIKPVTDEFDNVVLLVPEARDISERLKMEKQIRHSEAQHRTILNTMAEGVVIHQPDGEIMLVNPAAEELIGLSEDQMRGLTPVDPQWRCIHEDGTNFPGKEHPASITLAEGIPQYNVVMGVYKPDNLLTWISITSVPIFDVDNKLNRVIVTFSDITDLQNAKKQAVKVAVQRERINVIASFIQSASHEFRTPLAIMQTNTYLVRRLYADDEKLHSYLAKLDSQIDRMNRLVNRLLVMAKLDAIARLNYNTMIQPRLLMGELATSYANQLQQAQLTLQLEGEHSDAKIQSESDYLLIALRALLDNAIAHSSPGATIYFSLETSPDFAFITMQDEGTGILPDDMKYIFDRFWRADNSHSKEGFGLGLPLADRIIRLHHGNLTVDSDPGVGTTVEVMLPLI